MRYTQSSRRRALTAVGTVAAAFVQVLSLLGQPTSAQAATLASPTRVSVTPDDRVATLQWDTDPANPTAELPDGVVGYRITWGPANEPSQNTKLTQERVIQLQPLENGKPYVAKVQSVDTYGTLSGASETIRFTGDPRRVDELRSRMNGFFDDFNLPMGAPDELKWNTAFSRCNASWSNGFFVNHQFHAHNTIVTENCDRGQSINRARTLLDLSDNGTRTIVFDFDGEFRRNIWYLDLIPGLVDITGHVALEGSNGRGNPAGGLRIVQENQAVSIVAFDAAGTNRVIARTEYGKTYVPLDYAGVKLVPNVRRRWEVRVSRTDASITIDGKKVLATEPNAFQLRDDRFSVMWNTFSYNTTKANVPFVLVHWDNFGFDAPANSTSDTVTHNYKLNLNGSDYFDVSANAPATKTLNIPDTVTGARERRLMFTLQHASGEYQWQPGDAVVLNGTPILLPLPVPRTDPPLALNDFITPINPHSVVLPIPDGVLQQGSNTLTFKLARAGVLNLHIELDFPRNGAPAYTQPTRALLQASPMPVKVPKVGPNGSITRIGATNVETYKENLDQPGNFNQVVSGVVPIRVRFGNDIVMQSIGDNPGITQVDLLVNKRVVQSVRTYTAAPAPAVQHTFQLDTRTMKDGVYQVMAVAYSPNCTASLTDIGAVPPISGLYYPLHITVRNGRLAAAGGPLTESFVAQTPAPKFKILLPNVLREVLVGPLQCASAIGPNIASKVSVDMNDFVPPIAIRNDQFICVIE